jgi:alpha-galactosidase
MTSTTKKLAATPPMGWNSWNKFGNAINETSMCETADALVSSGLLDCGYNYLVIDDCWSDKSRRNKNGELVPDPQKFPNGIKPIADYVHSRGLLFGMYSDAADKTCAGYPGSFGFEEQDAATWASWGVDFLKYDYCNAPSDQATAIDRYARMGEALRGTGREILFSLCEWGFRNPHLWGKSVGGHMWRVSPDAFDSWVDIWIAAYKYYGAGIGTSLDIAAGIDEYGGPSGWNDLDMLVVGLRGKGQISGTGMSYIEYQTHMSIWCIACSPLMIGCDVRNLDAESASLLMNTEALAVNQDALGKPGRRIKLIGTCEVWRKPLADGSTAIAVVNRGTSGTDVTIRSGDMGLLDSVKHARNIWLKEDIADFTTELTLRVQAHETMFLKVTPS